VLPLLIPAFPVLKSGLKKIPEIFRSAIFDISSMPRQVASPWEFLHTPRGLQKSYVSMWRTPMSKDRNPTRTTRPVDSPKKRSRREFLKAGAATVAGASALSAPSILKAQQTMTWRFQST
jgi:hypothetical protein